jgi:two-component system, OmpR family, sensor histidine kinase KdpD
MSSYAGNLEVGYNQPVTSKFTPRAALRLLACAAVLALIVFVYAKLLHVNPTTAAVTFLLVILSVAAAWGLRYALVLSVAAALCFNFFFLPPLGTFTIADAPNWVALFAFFFAAVVGSNLSERARRQAAEAHRRRTDVERLYVFSQQLLIADNVLELLKSVPRYIMETFGATHAAIYLPARDQAYRSDADRQEIPIESLREASARSELLIEPAQRLAVAPLRMGVRTVGALGISGELPSRETLEAVGSLIATAIERARAVEDLTHTKASQESERLRSALLDSVTHEFRTPLTAIKASVTTLRSGATLTGEQQQDLLAVIDEESDRLNHLVGEAVEMAQLDAKEVKLDLGPHHIREAIEQALEDSKQALSGHPVEVRLPQRLPPALMDVTWIKKVLQHLLENAAKYSPPGSAIFVSSEAKNSRLITSVADRGAGIDDLERSMVFDKFYRGQGQRYRVQGTGMGLAIVKAIVEAHGGRIEVTSQLGHGSVFSFGLSLAPGATHTQLA